MLKGYACVIVFSMHASKFAYMLRSTLGNYVYILKEPQHLKLPLVNKMGGHSLLLPFIHFSSLTHLQVTFGCYYVLVTMSVR